MPQAYVCPDCGTRYSWRPQAERGERCPAYHRPKQQPLVYWRVVGVAVGTTALLLITLIFALKAWADSRRTATPAGPVPRMEDKNFLPAIVEREVPSAISLPELKPEPVKKEQPPQNKEESSSQPKDGAKPQAVPTPPPAKPEIAKTEIASKPDVKKPVEPEIAEPATQEVFKRLDLHSEEELRKELVQVPIFRRSNALDASLLKLANVPKNRIIASDEMPGFAGLPMRMGIDCQLGKEPAENLQVLSRNLRTIVAAAIPKDGRDPRPNAEVLRKSLLEGLPAEVVARAQGRDRKVLEQIQSAGPEWLHSEAVPTLVQLLMAENKPIRLLLVELLTLIPGSDASVALAQRALFDLSFEVREAAVQALKDRPFEEFRQILLDGLSYPWAPVNDHAAEALVALKFKDAVPKLINLLDRPDPVAAIPAESGKGQQVRELVRINHLFNCTLCHARSLTTTDLVRGPVPDPQQPLPSILSTPYYQGDNGPFVRADVTYLRQDFSVAQPVSEPGPWPGFQRFDYLVRTRPATLDEEIFGKFNQAMTGRQRQAVVFALRELTGIDGGNTATSWRRRLAEVEKHAPNGFN